MVIENDTLILKLKKIVGHRHVLTSSRSTKPYCKGYRSGYGSLLAVIRPGTLLEQWQTLKEIIAADKIIIMQAANTGLTGGSTPNGEYERDTIILNTMRLKEIHIIQKGSQVVSFPGATLFDLEKKLSPLNRQPHSVIGSSCIGASIVGGVCNNSGGALVERGPAYSELSLYAQVDGGGNIELVNHLEINLGNDPETILTRLQSGHYSEADILANSGKASDTEYHSIVRNIEADTPARFNADTRRLYEASGCAGKLAVFAVRLDTYEANVKEEVFYIGTNSPKSFTNLRRHILSKFTSLPVSGEYMHRDIYDLSKVYGKDSLLLIDKLGTDRLSSFFSFKGWLDSYLEKLPFLPSNASDRLLQFFGKLWPSPLTKRMENFRARFQHYLILKMQGDGIQEARAYLNNQQEDRVSDWFECSPREAKIAELHRFVAAGAPIRYQVIKKTEVEDILPLDIALRRNDQNWFETLPEELNNAISHKLYYGHFFCHVLHQDYIIKKGFDTEIIKNKILKILDKRGARYPAEHNVGHLYKASKKQAEFYKHCDPTNSLNPGIGKMSKKKNYI
jgi:D-lactate dehydrogenase